MGKIVKFTDIVNSVFRPFSQALTLAAELDVFDDNHWARHTYRFVEFQEEGVLREAALKSNGKLGSLVIISILARVYFESLNIGG